MTIEPWHYIVTLRESDMEECTWIITLETARSWAGIKKHVVKQAVKFAADEGVQLEPDDVHILAITEVQGGHPTVIYGPVGFAWDTSGCSYAMAEEPDYC